MTSNIGCLSPKQKAILPVWRDKWIAIGLSTKPADREKAEAAYRACYRYAGLRDDVPIVWVQSPVVGAFAAVIAEGLLKSGAVRGAVDGAVGGAVHNSNLQWHAWLGGSLCAAWPVYESYFREVCGLRLKGDLTERAAAYAATSEHGCYWWPNQRFIIACERPSLIRRDDAGRLHCESGPAIQWPDGWGLYSWHGVTVPSEWIDRKDVLTAASALG